MQTSLLLSLLAAASAIAAPTRSDTEIRVSLSDRQETGAQVAFQKLVRSEARPATSGPFSEVTLTLGNKVAQQNLRCQILDSAGKPITVTRGANVDVTFADGGKGAWSFPSTKVSKVVCDPAFKQGPPVASKPSVRVILEDQATETGSQTTLPFGQRVQSKPVGSSGPFSTVELNVGDASEQALRCQILDSAGKPITVTRGANVDITFSDAGKGAWSFPATKVSDIICDPAFKQGPPPAAKPPVRVILEDQATETGSQTSLAFGQRVQSRPVGSSGPFSTVELNVGDASEQALRCQIVDKNGKPITVTRGANVDVTFSDAGKGPWSFRATEVSNIICDPTFKAVVKA